MGRQSLSEKKLERILGARSTAASELPAAREKTQPLGHVLSVNGSQATVLIQSAGARREVAGGGATVGRFLGLEAQSSLLIGVITSIGSPPYPEAGTAHHAIGEVDLVGELTQQDGAIRFQRGVTEYPTIGNPARLISSGELRTIYDISSFNTIDVGRLQQDASIPAYINVDDMLNKHFAVFGTTGVGKSSGVALILGRVLDARPDLRIFLIDPHNEYGHCFDGRAQVLNPRNLKLPFWLFNFEETVDVFFRGRPGGEEEVEILAELIPQAKALFAFNRAAGPGAGLRRSDPKSRGYTADTPVPYLLPDLIDLIRERMGKLENRSGWAKYHKLVGRIESASNDPRYAFMFENANVGGDTMAECLSELFRLPANGRPMTIMQLAGFPAEVVDAVVSVLCRMAFDFGLWSDGAVPLLFVCEEAHRYAPADRTIGFGPTRKAVSRIAKEGRKYGVYLGLVTQRPAELDATIVSQCSTLFAMRMANDRDQAIVRAAVSDAATSLISFVPSLGTREVFAFGEGVVLPTRLQFAELPAHLIPKSESLNRGGINMLHGIDKEFVSSVIERWRLAMTTQRLKPEERDDIEALAADEFSAVPRTLAERATLKPDPTSSVDVTPRFSTAPARYTESSSGSDGREARAFSTELQELRQRLKNRG